MKESLCVKGCPLLFLTVVHLVLLLFCEFCAAHCKFGLERLYRKKVYYYHLLQTFLWWHLTNDVALVRDPIASAFQIAQFMNKTPLPLLTCLGYCTRKTGNDRLCTQQCSFQASDLSVSNVCLRSVYLTACVNCYSLPY